MRRCSCTVRFGKMPRPSGTRQSPARARSSGSAPFTRRPASTMLPPLAGCSPAMTDSRVVLPAPFGPEDGDHRAGRHVEVDAVEDLDRPVAGAHARGATGARSWRAAPR